MITNELLTVEWIRETAEKNHNADRMLVEKVIRAFMLLEGLSLSGLSYIFKGVTAVILLQGFRSDFP